LAFPAVSIVIVCVRAIPLTEFNRCNHFVSCLDEYLQYATRNREEWELKGRDVVASMNERAKNTVWGAETDHADSSQPPESDHDEGIEEAYVSI
jgi:hypothetical protein